jgi:hypothetical protein
MKRSLITICSLLLGGAGLLHAGSSTIVFSAQDVGSGVGGVDGTDLAVGTLVRFGYFDAAVDVAANWQDISLLNTHFTELAHTFTGYFNGNTTLDNTGAVLSTNNGDNLNYPGAFGASVSLDANALGIASTRMYIWAFDSSSTGTASAHAIFSDSAWAIGSRFTGTFDIGVVRSSDPGDVYLALLGPETSGTLSGPVNKLQSVPEPSSFLFGILGLGSLFLTRRRCP